MIRSRLIRGALAAALVSVLLTGCSTAAAPAPSPSATSRISLPSTPTAYFLGDSWTTGYSAEEGRGFPHVVGEALEWDVVLGPDSSGAGYVHTFNPYHPVFPEVAKTIDRISADIIVLQGGLNDVPGPFDQYKDAIRQTVRTLRAKSGGTPIVMVGPAPFQADVPQELTDIDRAEASVAEELSVPYISPLKEDWFNPQIVASLIETKSEHPTTAGHAYYGGRLAADLARLVRYSR